MMKLNKEQKAKFLELRENKYSAAFFGMVGNRTMEYEFNGIEKTYEDVMKIALDQEILCDKTRDNIKQEKIEGKKNESKPIRSFK